MFVTDVFINVFVLLATQPGQVEELGVFQARKNYIRRSARTGTVQGPVDPKIRFAQYRTPQLTLKPLFFEVPLQEPDPLFVGRQWLMKEIEDIVCKYYILMTFFILLIYVHSNALY